MKITIWIKRSSGPGFRLNILDHKTANQLITGKRVRVRFRIKGLEG